MNAPTFATLAERAEAAIRAEVQAEVSEAIKRVDSALSGAIRREVAPLTGGIAALMCELQAASWLESVRAEIESAVFRRRINVAAKALAAGASR